jgi:hypothetical protein
MQDSTYQSETHTDWLSERGIEHRLIKHAYRNRSLSQEDKLFNQTHAGVRSTVERVFGVQKKHYAICKDRYLGLGRNRTRVELMCVAFLLDCYRYLVNKYLLDTDGITMYYYENWYRVLNFLY